MPEPRVLAAYGSKTAGTAGIAAHLAEAAQAEDVGYDAVIQGGAVRMGRWHPDSHRFADRYRRALADRPVWLFSIRPDRESGD